MFVTANNETSLGTGERFVLEYDLGMKDASVWWDR